MDATKHDDVRVGGSRLARQPERVAHVVGDILDLGDLVVVRQDDCITRAGQLANLTAHALHVARQIPARVFGGVRFERNDFYRHVRVTARLKSSAGAECASAPTEIRSTPALAAAPAPPSATPPDAT